MAVGSEPKQTGSVKPNLSTVVKFSLELKIEGEAGGVEFKNNNSVCVYMCIQLTLE